MWSRWLIALVAVAWVALGDAPAAQVRPATRAATQPATRPAAGAKAAVIVMRGVVDAYNRSSLERRVALARAAGAQAIIVEIDSPGGELGAMLGMSRLLKTQTDVYMMAFINPYAFSSGAVISAAADEIVMAPGGLSRRQFGPRAGSAGADT